MRMSCREPEYRSPLSAVIAELFCAQGEPLDDALCCLRVVRSNVFVAVADPGGGFLRPRYFRQERIRRPISSCEITRPASSSARPRWIMV